MTSLWALLTSHVLGAVQRRQAIAVATVLALAAWLIRVWPPGELRAMAWAGEPEGRAVVLTGVAALWVRGTRGFALRLVVADDVRSLRALPIAPSRWRVVLSIHLMVVDAPVIGAVVFGVAPMIGHAPVTAATWCLAVTAGFLAVRVAQCVAAGGKPIIRGVLALAATGTSVVIVTLSSPSLAIAMTLVFAATAVARLGHAFAEPRATRAWSLPWRRGAPAVALARLYLEVTRRTDARFVVLATLGQSLAAGLAALAVVRVDLIDPAGARGALVVFSMAAASLATWAALRTERIIARDRAALDPWIATSTIDFVGRMLAATIHTLPLVIATVIAWLATMHARGPLAITFAVAIAAWSVAATMAIAVPGVAHDGLHDPRAAAVLTRALVVGTTTVLFGPAVPFTIAATELAIAWSRSPNADRRRRRFPRGAYEAA